MPDIKGPLRELKAAIAREAGKEASEAIMTGSHSLRDSSPKEDVAHWVKSAVERMDNTLDAGTRAKIMNSCGRNCADHTHTGPVANALKRRANYTTLEDFLDSEARNPPRGMLVKRDGDAIIFSYTPGSFGVRCYCSLVYGLPPDETMSSTYCGCSAGFVERYWEQVLRRPVRVELLESALTGSDVCKFRVA